MRLFKEFVTDLKFLQDLLDVTDLLKMEKFCYRHCYHWGC